MDQRNTNKIKLFRTLKVVFYCLGLPLFFLAACAVATTFLGRFPFSANAEFWLLDSWTTFFNSSAMYGVWVALGVWLVIAAVQITLHFTVKNRRVRSLIAVVVLVIVMLVPVFVMDAVFTKKIDDIAAKAPAGVVVDNYKTQLSYYHTRTGSGGNPNGRITSMTDNLIKSVEDFIDIYNIGYYYQNKEGKANNTANTPVYYDELGVDINKDNVVDAKDHLLVKDAPTGGKLVVDGKVFEGYYVVSYAQKVPDGFNSAGVVNPTRYLWYKSSKLPEKSDGAFGEAVYNKNGLLADGYVFGIDTALNILEQYYYAKETLEAELGDQFQAKHDAIVAAAEQRRTEHYNSNPELAAIWNSELAQAEDFSLTQGELATILNTLGSEVGRAKLLSNILGLVGNLTGGALNLNLADLIGSIAGETLAPIISKVIAIDGVSLGILYQEPAGLTLTFSGGVFTEPISFGIDENLLDNLEIVLNKLGVSNSLLGEVLGLVGLSVTITDEDTLEEAVLALLQTIYWYSSPLIEPVYDFYVADGMSAEDARIAKLFAQYDRASYEGGMHGYVIGSCLIGGTLGDGPYTQEQGLTSYVQVKQLQTDLSYKPTYYPLFSVRDLLLGFVPFVALFMILSYISAEREVAFATGAETAKERKARKKRNNKKSAPEEDTGFTDGFDDVTADNQSVSEDAALNVAENNDGEVK